MQPARIARKLPEHARYSVGIIGTGRNLLSAGWQMSEQLCRRRVMPEQFFLVNRTRRHAETLKEYLAVVAQQQEQAPPPITVCNLDELVEAQPTVTLVAVDGTPPARLEEHQRETGKLATSWRELVATGKMNRDDVLAYNGDAIRGIAQSVAARKKYSGNFLIYTNPVDVVTYLFLKESGLDQSQVAGFNEGDSMRFRRVLLDGVKEGQALVDISDIDAFVLGPHNEYVVPIFSHISIMGYGFMSFASRRPSLQLDALQKKTVGEAQRWMELLGSTSPELSGTAARVIDCWARRDEKYQPTLSVQTETLYGTQCMGQRVSLRNGRAEAVDIALDKSETEQLDRAARLLAYQISRL